MSQIIRRAHLVLVAAFGERIADPPILHRRRLREEERAERIRRAREAAREAAKKER